MNRRHIYILLVTLVFPFFLNAQPWHLPLHFDIRLKNAAQFQGYDSLHTALKPLIIDKPVLSKHSKLKYTKPVFWKRLFTDNIFYHTDSVFSIYVNPLFNLQYGKETIAQKNVWTNTRGIQVRGNIGQKLSFYSDFYENQAVFEDYLDLYIKKQGIIPGQGAPKSFNNTGYDFSSASGYLTFQAFSSVIIEAGHGKHFIGHGYRSLLLSDNSFNYPYLKIITRYKKFQYALIYNELLNFTGKYYHYHYKKYGSFLYLSWSPLKHFEAGFFEGIIWRIYSAEDKPQAIHPVFFVPVIAVRKIGMPLNGENNMVYGLNLRYNVKDMVQLYGQFVLDELKHADSKEIENFNKRYGFQTGFKIYNILKNKFVSHQLFVTGEYNFVKPFTFSHTMPRQHYSHYNQPLSHPMGAGFREFVSHVYYHYKRFYSSISYKYTIASEDTTGTNFGSDIFRNPVNTTGYQQSKENVIGRGIRKTISHLSIETGIIVNPAIHLTLFTRYHQRIYQSRISEMDTKVFEIGLSTRLSNYYDDI